MYKLTQTYSAFIWFVWPSPLVKHRPMDIYQLCSKIKSILIKYHSCGGYC